MDSPEIRIRCIKDDDEFVLDTLRKGKGEGEVNKGFKINCFLRPANDEEQDGHWRGLKEC